MKKLYLIGVCLLVLGLVLSGFGCAQPATGPEKTEVELLAGRPGDSFTVLTFALGSFINQDSEWLRATVLSTGGMGDTQSIINDEPERRARATGLGIPHSAYTFMAETGIYPIFIARLQQYACTWITYDPNIKTLEDFAGKVVAGPREAPGWWETWRIPLEEAGVLDKIKLSHTGMGGAATALMDGTADIAYAQIDYVFPDKITPSSRVEQAAVKGPIYYVDWGKELIEVTLAEKIGWPNMALEVPPGTLGPTQPDKIYLWSAPIWWGADRAMDEDIAYEIARVVYGRAGQGDFGGYHALGTGITADFVPYSSWTTKEDIEEWYHPGALKFYREMGLPGF